MLSEILMWRLERLTGNGSYVNVHPAIRMVKHEKHFPIWYLGFVFSLHLLWYAYLKYSLRVNLIWWKLVQKGWATSERWRQHVVSSVLSLGPGFWSMDHSHILSFLFTEYILNDLLWINDSFKRRAIYHIQCQGFSCQDDNLWQYLTSPNLCTSECACVCLWV